MKNAYSSLSVAIEALQKEGYTEDFNLVDEGMEAKAIKKMWKAHELEVVKFFRFEGLTNPGDNTILYVIETLNGHKGLLVDVYGAESSNISREMIKKLSMHHDQ